MKEKITFDIDGDDVLVAASASWDPFAISNSAPELTASAVCGRRLFEFIADPETCEVQRMILQQARNSSRSLRYKIRCDSPTHLRLLQLVVSSPDHESVCTESSLLRMTPQNSGPLLDRRVARQGEMLRICSWCCRSKVGSDWLEPAEAAQALGLFKSMPVPHLTHGMCDECFQKASSIELDQ